MFDLLISGYFAFSFCFKFIISVAICSHCFRAHLQNLGGRDQGICLLLVLVSTGQGAFEGCAWHVQLLKEMKDGTVKAFSQACFTSAFAFMHALVISVASWGLIMGLFSFSLWSVLPAETWGRVSSHLLSDQCCQIKLDEELLYICSGQCCQQKLGEGSLLISSLLCGQLIFDLEI